MNGQAADASAKCACDETVPAKGGPSQVFRIETGKRIVFMADQKKQGVLGYVFLIPSLAAFCVFMFYPLFYTVYLSFFDWNMIQPQKKFVGFQNYVILLRDPNTWKILGNTFWYIVILLILNWALPYLVSFVLSFVVGRMRGFYKSALFLPSIISLVVGSILYTWILNPVS
ncbi:MAG TPA: hypothetical protein DHV79_09405, partial [Lachnospiraceae bacterium]|nr:hypothetical protein [Lachnospiraceae bacterium]